MEYSEQALSTINRLRENPGDAALQREAGNIFWRTLEEHITEYIMNSIGCDTFISNEFNTINFGIIKELLGNNAEEAAESIKTGVAQDRSIKIILISDWLHDVYIKTVSGDKKESLEKEVTTNRDMIQRLENDIKGIKKHRLEVISNELGMAFSEEALKRSVNKIDGMEDLFRQNLRVKKMSSKGIFIPVEEKRRNCEREKEYASGSEMNDRFLAGIQSRETLAEIKQLGIKIRENISEIIDCEDTIAGINMEIEKLSQKQNAMSPVEIASAISREIAYHRDMLKLSANRLHIESCCFMRPGEQCFTIKELETCIDRIIEFDPTVFCNTRVPIFGVPSILLTPGNGNSVYDWKNNRIVVPMSPPGGNFMASVAYGMIEYRLDVDETKELLTSYGKLPQHSGTKSVFSLKNDLTKDYITWMTLEYRGYKSLRGETRKWFEHEIAPDKNEIAVPMELMPFFMPAEAFKKKCDGIVGLSSGSINDINQNELWTGSILLYQQGKFERAIEFLKALVKSQPSNALAFYNMGQMCAKTMRKQEAISYFNEYCRLNPQSWWASVAMEHLRRLQTGHA
jgi:tetratricopeptide (TPR) repeat protein